MTNDNNKSPAWLDDRWELCKRVDYGLYKKLRKKLPDYREERAIYNFLWFVEFEASYKQIEVEEKRKEIKVVKTNPKQSCKS
jgi:hypothetical protein